MPTSNRYSVAGWVAPYSNSTKSGRAANSRLAVLGGVQQPHAFQHRQRRTAPPVKLAEGVGIPARRVSTAEEFAEALRGAFVEPGPHLIDTVVPSLLG